MVVSIRLGVPVAWLGTLLVIIPGEMEEEQEYDEKKEDEEVREMKAGTVNRLRD